MALPNLVLRLLNANEPGPRDLSSPHHEPRSPHSTALRDSCTRLSILIRVHTSQSHDVFYGPSRDSRGFCQSKPVPVLDAFSGLSCRFQNKKIRPDKRE